MWKIHPFGKTLACSRFCTKVICTIPVQKWHFIALPCLTLLAKVSNRTGKITSDILHAWSGFPKTWQDRQLEMWRSITSWSKQDFFCVVNVHLITFLALTTVRVEPVGRWYEAFCSRRHHQQTLSHGSLVSSSSEDEEAELILDDEDDSQLLSSLDPKEWKVREHVLCCRLIYNINLWRNINLVNWYHNS